MNLGLILGFYTDINFNFEYETMRYYMFRFGVMK